MMKSCLHRDGAASIAHRRHPPHPSFFLFCLSCLALYISSQVNSPIMSELEGLM